MNASIRDGHEHVPTIKKVDPRIDPDEVERARRERATELEKTNWLADSDERNDNYLATRFIDDELLRLRYVVEWRNWLVWNDQRWVVDTGNTQVLRLARLFSKSLWLKFRQLDHSRMKKETIDAIVSFIRSANKRAGILAYIDLARADARVAVSVADLDQQAKLLNLPNGTYDLESGQLRPHCRDDLLTQVANVEHDANATAPRWQDALTTIFDGDIELLRYVQQLLGYSLAGDTGEHLLPIAYGSGCNGKSTLWNVVLELLGDYAGLANDSLLLGLKDAHPTEKAFLYQKRFVPISEPEQSAKLRESRVKELTGDSTITARRMKEDFWSFRRTHTFWLSTNHLPRITGNDDGIWRRVKLIPFVVDLRTVTNPVPNLDKQLVSNEGSGILNWLLDGYRDYQANGFIEPESVKSATSVYRNQEDELRLFIDECCIVASTCITTANALYDRYSSWGGKLTRASFGRQMGERYQKKVPTAGEFRKQTIYEGIGILNEYESPNF